MVDASAAKDQGEERHVRLIDGLVMLQSIDGMQMVADAGGDLDVKIVEMIVDLLLGAPREEAWIASLRFCMRVTT